MLFFHPTHVGRKQYKSQQEFLVVLFNNSFPLSPIFANIYNFISLFLSLSLSLSSIHTSNHSVSFRLKQFCCNQRQGQYIAGIN